MNEQVWRARQVWTSEENDPVMRGYTEAREPGVTSWLTDDPGIGTDRHPEGCGCAGCAMRPEPGESSTTFAAGSDPFAAAATGTLGEMADYLRIGYWADENWYPFSWNLTSSGSNANSGYLLYSLSGFSNTDKQDLDGITDDRKALVREAFKMFEEVLGIDFRETTSEDPTTVDFFFLDNEAGAYAQTFISPASGTASRSYINIAEGWSEGTSTYNDYTLQTILHEIGHALGLGHQGNYNGAAAFPGDATFANDSWQASMMSYFAQTENPAVDADYELLQTPMAVDWIALDDIYGGQSHNGTTYGVENAFTGDTVYGFNTNIPSDVSDIWANFSAYAHVSASTLVDGGGIDTLDLSGFAADQRIDLTPSSRGATAPVASDIGGRSGNLTIAAGTIIENVKGGSGRDEIIGNSAENLLVGNEGADTLTGGSGRDLFVVGPGDGADVVTDFTDGEDRLDLSAFPRSSALGAVAGAAAGSAVVSFADGTTVTLQGIAASAFGLEDVVLAAAPAAAAPDVDVDASGTTDILLQNGASRAEVIWYMAGPGEVADRFFFDPPGWDVDTTGDFDGNGTTDLVLRNDAGGGEVIWYMDQGGSVADRFFFDPPGWDVDTTGDFDGNGTTDLVLRNDAGG
ncbi:MAG: matrixin family metalloprotease, partial [Planctomycetes bacterium]|nr:matrixin family metalloprotease [Planctomycetota bacterium]